MLRILLPAIVFLVFAMIVPRLFSRSVQPKEGDSAPEFTLMSQEGTPVHLQDYRGQWVVLYFYPKDQTPG
jgi:thioredoxin-dependent peroxiredoxin